MFIYFFFQIPVHGLEIPSSHGLIFHAESFFFFFFWVNIFETCCCLSTVLSAGVVVVVAKVSRGCPILLNFVFFFWFRIFPSFFFFISFVSSAAGRAGGVESDSATLGLCCWLHFDSIVLTTVFRHRYQSLIHPVRTGLRWKNVTGLVSFFLSLFFFFFVFLGCHFCSPWRTLKLLFPLLLALSSSLSVGPFFSSSTSWAHSLLTDNKIWEEVKIKRP